MSLSAYPFSQGRPRRATEISTLYALSEENRFRGDLFGVIIETAAVDAEDLTNISHGMLLLQCQNSASLFS